MSMAEGLRDLGYDVEDVGTAHEALEAVRMGFRPDAVVTDVASVKSGPLAVTAVYTASAPDGAGVSIDVVQVAPRRP